MSDAFVPIEDGSTRRQSPPGALFVVATPIGNLNDISARALEVLAAVSMILAEDTRVTRRLLERYGVATPLAALHAHNEHAATRAAMARLETGERLALVSDAGTPLLSDPGLTLVAAAHEAGVPVHPIPGPSAVAAALSVSGLPGTRFWFEGFLPPKREARKARLRELSAIAGTLVFFEAPHRICECLDDLVSCFGGDTPAAFARELTKIHEQTMTGHLSTLRAHFDGHSPRGEFVVLVHNREREAVDDARIREVLAPLLEHLPVREAAGLVAKLTGARRNRVYELALGMKE